MHQKKLRFWFEKDGKRKRTPKVSPKVIAPKIVIKEPAKKNSPPRLVDETVIDPTELIKQGADLLNMTFDQYIKQTEAAAKVQGSNVEKAAETSTKNVEAESVKEKEAEGVVHTDSSATKSDTEPEFDTSRLGVGKIKLKVKPLKEKKKDSYEEDSTYIPTPQEKKKKVIKKRKATPSGVIPRNVRERKGTATMPELQSSKAPEVEVQSIKDPEVEKKTPESPIYEKVEKNVEAEKDDDEVEFMGERESTPPPPPVNPTIHIPDDPQEPSSAKKDNNSSSSQGFPSFPDNLGPGPLSLDDVGDLFNEGKINLLTKRVSILEKVKKKAEAEQDELKQNLMKVLAENDELKLAVNDHAERIDELTDDLGEQAKVIDQLTTELAEVNVKYENMNEVNKTLHQMIGELHEPSSNENKVLRQEIEALRADKVVKDEQLNMLYTVMEHKLGINVQAVCNDLEIQRVEQRRIQREKELDEEATQKKKSVVVDSEEILGSSSQQVQPEAESIDVEMTEAEVNTSEVDPKQGFVLVGESFSLPYSLKEVIRLVKVDQRKRRVRKSDTKLLCYKEEKDDHEEEEEEKLDDEELKKLFDDIDNNDPENDNDDNDDQEATGLLVVKPTTQYSLDDFQNDQLNDQQDDQQQESSSSGKQHADQV
ncbi:putative transcription factor bZIP family [Helianthus annuus]|nr:putative transcription factor bZIP family [Helianthus annuus]